MILLKKGCISNNVPSQNTYFSREHKICVNNKMIKAIDLVNGDTIIKEFRGHEDIYNILLKIHRKMIVNKLNVETLNPNNEFAK